MIDKEYLINLIRQQFADVINADDELKQFKVRVCEEQMFMRKEPNTIYIVVKFSPATLTQMQKIMPITISAIGEHNSLNVCEHLLMSFAEKYHLEFNQEKTVRQVFTSPSVISNFNEVFDGFRSLFYMSGTFLVSENANRVDVIFDGNKIETIEAVFECTVQLDTQPTFESKNFTNSVGKVATRVLSFTSYLTDVEYINNALKISVGDTSIDNKFYFDLQFKNGISLKNLSWKLSSMTINQSIADFPMIALVFTN